MAHRSNNFSEADTPLAVTAMDIAGTGTGTFLLKKLDGVLAYNPDQVFSRHQISMTGLDGGTFDVNILQPGSPGFALHHPGAAEGDTVMIESPVAKQIQIVLTGMGATAVPVLHFTSMPRMS